MSRQGWTWGAESSSALGSSAAAMWDELGFTVRDGSVGPALAGAQGCFGGCSPGLAKGFIFPSKHEAGMWAHGKCCIVRDRAPVTQITLWSPQAWILPAADAIPCSNSGRCREKPDRSQMRWDCTHH